MKSLVKGTLFAAIATFAFTACNKDQACINKLDGEWKATGGTAWKNGTEVVDTTTGTDTVTTTYTFTSYKIKDADQGVVTFKTTTPNTTPTTISMQYSILEDCTKFWMGLTGLGGSTYDIVSSSGKTFVYEYQDTLPSGTGTDDIWKYQIELTKQ